MGYPIRSTARKFYDSEGNECTLKQLVSDEPDWAVSRIIRLELALERLASCEAFFVSKTATKEEKARMKYAEDMLGLDKDQ